MDTWTIIGVFFLGVFSYRFLASLLNYTHSYNFLTYCLASCLTMIRSFGKDVVTVKERLIKQMEDLDIPEKEKEVMKKEWKKLSMTGNLLRLSVLLPLFQKSSQRS